MGDRPGSGPAADVEATAPSGQPGRAPPGPRDVLVAVGVVLAFLVALQVASTVAVRGGTILLSTSGVVLATGVHTAVIVLLAEVVGVALSLLYLARRGSLSSLVRVPTHRDRRWVLGGYGASMALVGGFVVLARLASLAPVRNAVASRATGDPGTLALLAVLSLVAVGPGEELVYRGVVQRVLRGVAGPATAAVAAGLVFGLSHLLVLSGRPLGVVLVMAVLAVHGTVWGYAYERTGNLLVPVLLHGAYDATLFLLAALVA